MSSKLNDVVTVAIEDIGASGDGVGQYDERKIFIPYSLPGEKVTARIVKISKDQIKAELLSVENTSADRKEPPCPHFTQCGGCNLQHLSDDAYYAFKQRLLETAVRRAGFDNSVIAPFVQIGQGTRRRANFKVSILDGKVELGYFEEWSHRLVDINECLILEDAIFRCIAPLKKILAKVGTAAALKEVTVSLTDTGLDILVFSLLEPVLSELELLGSFAREQDVARITWKSPAGLLPVISQRPVEMFFGEVSVAVPVESFIQASKLGQKAITEEVLQALPHAKSVVDFYAGCGTYTFPLAGRAKVHAVEGDRAMMQSITQASARYGYTKTVTAEQRDIFASPLEGDALASYDAAIINPPRNGASSQITAIAASAIPVVVMVSCNPGTFSRDARILKDAGYNLTRVVAVDQFYLSSHLEVVGVFQK